MTSQKVTLLKERVEILLRKLRANNVEKLHTDLIITTYIGAFCIIEDIPHEIQRGLILEYLHPL